MIPGIVASAVITPLDISGLRCWYTVDTLSSLADGAAVASWPDSSGNGLTMAQGTSGNRPTVDGTNLLNGRRIVAFDGSNDFLSVAGSISPSSGQWSAFVVAKVDTVSGVHSIFDNDEGTGSNRIAQIVRTNGTAAEAIAFNTGPSAFTDGGGTTISTSTYFLFTAVRTSSAIEMWVNQSSGGSTATTGTPATASTTRLTLGGGALGPSQFLNGRIAEVVGYSKAVSSIERSVIESYLKARFAI